MKIESIVREVAEDVQGVRESLVRLSRNLVDLETRILDLRKLEGRATSSATPAREPGLLTFQQFVDRHPEWTVRRLQHLRFHEKRYGLESCFVKLGRRVLVKEGEFLEALSGET